MVTLIKKPINYIYTLAKKILLIVNYYSLLSKETKLTSLFWLYLFFPDAISRLLLWLISDIREIFALNVIYSAVKALIYLSCVYFPVLYVIIWQKATRYRGDPIWATFTKLYVILSAASSNFAYIFIGQGVI